MNRDEKFKRWYVGTVIVSSVVVIAITLNAWSDPVIRDVCVGSGAILLLTALILFIYARSVGDSNR